MTVRAVRNNNPGNIRIGQNWQGEMLPANKTPEQAAEKEFEVFATATAGFRAMATIFETYAKKHGVKTIRGAISRWAPPTENNTGAYVNVVCQHLRVGPDDPFPFLAEGAMQELCFAVAKHEAGGWFFKTADLAAGVKAALR